MLYNNIFVLQIYTKIYGGHGLLNGAVRVPEKAKIAAWRGPNPSLITQSTHEL